MFSIPVIRTLERIGMKRSQALAFNCRYGCPCCYVFPCNQLSTWMFGIFQSCQPLITSRRDRKSRNIFYACQWESLSSLCSELHLNWYMKCPLHGKIASSASVTVRLSLFAGFSRVMNNSGNLFQPLRKGVTEISPKTP